MLFSSLLVGQLGIMASPFSEQKLEGLVPDIRLLLQMKVYNQEEVRSLIKDHRKEYHRLLRLDVTRRDYMKFTGYQMNLLLLIKTRMERLGIHPKKKAKVVGKFNSRYASDRFRS